MTQVLGTQVPNSQLGPVRGGGDPGGGGEEGGVVGPGDVGRDRGRAARYNNLGTGRVSPKNDFYLWLRREGVNFY